MEIDTIGRNNMNDIFLPVKDVPPEIIAALLITWILILNEK